METRSRSTLFLMEQMIAILVFAFCAAICVKLISEAHIIATNSNDIKNSIIAAENGAECFKAFLGDADSIATTLGGEHTAIGEITLITVYYDNEWRVTNDVLSVYIMTITSYVPDNQKLLKYADISVNKTNGEELLALKVAVPKGYGHRYE